MTNLRTMMMKKTIDWGDSLDTDYSEYFKPKKKKVVFEDEVIDPLTEVQVKETIFNPNDYKVECGDLSLYCAAMYGGPLF